MAVLGLAATIAAVAPAGAGAPSAEAVPGAGTRAEGAFRVSVAGIPAGIRPERFVAIARSGGERWGLVFAGTTVAAPVTGDGRSVVGFGATTIPGAGAEATSAPRTVARRVRRCHGGRGGRIRAVRRCRSVAVALEVTERDIAIDPALPWQPGPAHPSPSQVDLETALLHEFGHLAGQDHVDGCASTPMWPELRMGDWWRGPADTRRADC